MPEPVTVRRPRLSVLAADPGDVVRAAGGLIVDRVRLGWHVTTLVPSGVAPQPLHVLGTDVADLTASTEDREHRTALLVAASLYVDDRTVRSEVDDAMAAETIEVLWWGPAVPDDHERGSKSASYRPSRAAMAFKTHAMRAAGLAPLEAPSVETFRTRCARHVIAREFDIAG